MVIQHSERVLTLTSIPRDLYWRGLVLSQFDGRSWHRAPDDVDLFEEAPTSYDQLIDYSIVVEPHNQTWLFALATPCG